MFSKCSGKQFDVACRAVWFPLLLLENPLAKLMKTEGTDKVLGVELALQGRDASTSDGLPTAPAECALAGMEVERA